MGCGLLGTVNCGKVNIWGTLTEDKSHSGKVFLCRCVSELSVHRQREGRLVLLVCERGAEHLHKGKHIPCL